MRPPIIRRERSHALALAMFIVLLACTSGCTPSVQLRSTVLQGASAQGPRFDAILSIENPNAFDVQVRAVRANVRVGSIAAPIPVVYEPNLWIPAHRTVSVAVPVTVPWAMTPALAAQSATTPVVSYTIVGRADITASSGLLIERDNYSFEEDGTVPRTIFVQSGRTAPGAVGLGLPGWR